MKIWAKKKFYIHRHTPNKIFFDEIPPTEKETTYLQFYKDLPYNATRSERTSRLQGYLVNDWLKFGFIPNDLIVEYDLFELESERIVRIREEKLNQLEF